MTKERGGNGGDAHAILEQAECLYSAADVAQAYNRMARDIAEVFEHLIAENLHECRGKGGQAESGRNRLSPPRRAGQDRKGQSCG